ncbi:MAG: hypothetical protein IKF64_03175 [Eubacterium sp.]|nr:hypothetical protein [Eubacterium sp.]
MSKIINSLISLIPILIGGGLISTALHSREEYDQSSFIATLIIGGIMIAGGIAFIFAVVIPEFKDKNVSVKKDLKRIFLPERKGKEDSNDKESLVTEFKQTYRDFFASPGITENSTLQSTATQMFWHILYLQKKRMKTKGVTLEFDSERMTYGGVSVSKNVYSDAKYTVTEINERIKALRTYKASGGKVMKIKNNDLAHYALARARTTTTDNNVICPNCGMETTRENLLDGCDYCGTKFTVEDLGLRVSSFVLRKDLRTELSKLADYEERLIPYLYTLLVAPVFIASSIGMIFAWDELDAGFFMKITACVFSVAIITGISAFISSYIVAFIVEPLGTLLDSITTHLFRKEYEKNLEIRSKNDAVIAEIKRFDRNFSQENFLSNVQNKLAAIHFADGREAQAFALVDLSKYTKQYQNVVDMEITDVILSFSHKDEEKYTVKMEVSLNLLFYDNNRFKRGKEKLALTLIRAATCKTEAVCAPSVFKCKSCGNSITLLSGGYCEYCSAQLNLFEYDWVISEYEIIE